VHDRTVVQAALALRESGLSIAQIARDLGVPRPTVNDWVLGKIPRVREPLDQTTLIASLPRSYVYLLGLYLGDGCISAHPRGAFKLRIALDSRYPRIIRESSMNARTR
jgi:hypothetical protein